MVGRKHIAALAVGGCLLCVGTGAAATRYIITSPSQIKPSVLKRLMGRRGPRGFNGQTGPVGPVGQTGPAGPAGQTVRAVQSVDGTVASIDNDGTATSTATCPAGTVLTGGGMNTDDADATMFTSSPVGNSWTVIMTDHSDSVSNVFYAIAMCAS